MVYESCYWKDDLRSYAKELSDFSTCTTLEDEYRDYRLEKALLLSAFTVRLLLDANKLSDRIGSLNLKVDFYPAKIEAQKNISPLDKRFIDERYFDLASPTSSSISLRQLTNQLIPLLLWRFHTRMQIVCSAFLLYPITTMKIACVIAALRSG